MHLFDDGHGPLDMVYGVYEHEVAYRRVAVRQRHGIVDDIEPFAEDKIGGEGGRHEILEVAGARPELHRGPHRREKGLYLAVPPGIQIPCDLLLFPEHPVPV